MINGLMKNRILINFFIWIFIAYFSATPSFAVTASPMPRNANVDEAMVNTYLRYGNVVADQIIRSMGFRGTGFPVTPSNAEQIIGAVAAQWIFGITPKGIENYSTDMVSEGEKNKAYAKKEADLLRQIGEATLGFVPTQLSKTFESSDPNEQGKIKKLEGGVANIAFSDANSTGSFINVMRTGLANQSRLAQSVGDLNGALPEKKGERDIGKNSSSNGTSSSGSPFIGIEETITPGRAKDAQLALTTGGWANTLLALFNPDGGDIAVSSGKMPSNISNAKTAKNVSSAQVTGTGEYAGTSAQVAGLTNVKPGSPIGDLSDINRILEATIAENMTRSEQQFGNTRNYFPNGRLEQLANQFPPNNLKEQIPNRFPDSNSGGGQPPTVDPNTPISDGCDPAKAVLSKQEVVDIADFLGLPITTAQWKNNYIKAQQLYNQSVYLGNSSTLITLGSDIIPDPQACIWVVYAPSENTGVYVSDVRSQTGTKFMFTMP
jgi:hypothetical protein